MSDTTEYIYILTDPRDGSVKYVGRSINPEQRYQQHLPPAWNTAPEKRAWLIELRGLGLKPVITIIDQADNRKEASTKETQWIHRYTNEGALLLNSVSVKQREWQAKMDERARIVKEQYHS
jgi:hypothetical protein